MLLSRGRVQYPADVDEHDQGWHHQARHDGDAANPRVIYREDEETNADQYGHVAACSTSLLLWNKGVYVKWFMTVARLVKISLYIIFYLAHRLA